MTGQLQGPFFNSPKVSKKIISLVCRFRYRYCNYSECKFFTFTMSVALVHPALPLYKAAVISAVGRGKHAACLKLAEGFLTKPPVGCRSILLLRKGGGPRLMLFGVISVKIVNCTRLLKTACSYSFSGSFARCLSSSGYGLPARSCVAISSSVSNCPIQFAAVKGTKYSNYSVRG